MVTVRDARPECEQVNIDPRYLTFGEDATMSSADAEFALSCISTTGVSGCGKQSLESMWKALAPSAVGTFVGPDSLGQGDRANAGFLRDDSVLVVVLITDEDDCSVTSAGTIMFERGGEPTVNVRCQLLADDPAYLHTVQPISRYVDGLMGLRASAPERMIFTALVGVPPTADTNDLDALLSRADMQARVSEDSFAQLASTCVDHGAASGPSEAYPGRRHVKLAQGIRDAGGTGIVSSICADDYAPAIDSLLAAISAQLPSACAP